MTHEEMEAIRPILEVENPIVLELGAYCGEDESIFRSLAHPRDLVLVMVEPDPRNIRIIEEKPLDLNRRLVKGAVARDNGWRDFRFSTDSRDGSRGSGSLKIPTGHLEHFPTISFSEPESVECFTLDQLLLDQMLPKIDLLWVDIQGAEREMIEGGRLALRFARFLFIEAEEIQMYEGQALKSELIEMLKDWTVIHDFGYNLLLRNDQFVRRR